jgi:maltooligosyltrehalose trehalohydrolase
MSGIQSWNQKVGALPFEKDRCGFRIWAPLAQKVEVSIVSPGEQTFPLQRQDRGYHTGVIEDLPPGSLYFYRLDGQKNRPDPASRFQPQGVHGPSQVVSLDFPWEDGCWFGLPLADYILYELHVGTFTSEGTFEAVIPHLDEMKALGITAIEIMPVAQFPGNRNWGYDGVYPFAVQDSYGGPEGLKKLVNSCHQRGMAVVLDVVYNHLGPEGNYLSDFGPYFTDRYHTPWGAAINFDGPHSDEVRNFFIQNALSWITEFHMDGLRLDALHAVFDSSARPFLQELAERFHGEGERINRRVYLFAESDRNDIRFIQPSCLGGYGLDVHWNDDFHHAVHTLLTGEKGGYYEDFGRLKDLAKAFAEGFIYSGQYSSYRRRRHGSPSRTLPAERFLVFSQNHDQVGNRMLGERLSQVLPLDGLKLAAGTVLLSPFLPLLFMGEEYGEKAPFQYFVSHSDPDLIEAVRKGRQQEFSAFAWQGKVSDPQDEKTFLRCRLDRTLRRQKQHQVLYDFYRELIRLRKETRPLALLNKDRMEVLSYETEKVLYVRRWEEGEEAILLVHFGNSPAEINIRIPPGCWQKQLDSQEKRWGGPGSGIPEWIHSEGEVRVSLGPQSLLCLWKKEAV